MMRPAMKTILLTRRSALSKRYGPLHPRVVASSAAARGALAARGRHTLWISESPPTLVQLLKAIDWPTARQRRAEEKGFGASLRRLRLQRGLRREDFAPLSPKTIARIEQGRVRNLHAKTQATIAMTLGVQPEEIETY